MRLTTIAFRNLGRHTRRTILSISTISLACVFGLFMLALVTGMKGDMKSNILAYYTGAVQIRDAEFNKYDYLNPIHLYVKDVEKLQEELLQIDGVTQAVGRISAGGKLFIDEDPDDDVPGVDYNVMAVGIDFEGEKDILEPESLLIEGRLPASGSREVVLGVGLAGKTGLEVGDKFSFLTMTAERSANAWTFEVSGLVKYSMGNLNNTQFLVPLGAMQNLMHMPGGVQEILVMTDDPDNAEPQDEAIKNLIATNSSFSGLETTLWKNYGIFYPMMGMAELIYSYIVIIFLALGGTVIINTTMMVIFERYREIGILGAMGMKPKEIVNLFFYEGVFAGIISAVVGLIVGITLTLILEKVGLNFGSVMDGMDLEVSSIIYPDLKFYHVVLMAFYTVGITSLVTLIPSRTAANIEPDQAIRST